jgi:hypothetical protein
MISAQHATEQVESWTAFIVRIDSIVLGTLVGARS